MAVSDVLEPTVHNVQVTSGDSARLELRFKTNGVPVDMSQFDGSVAPIIDPNTDQTLDNWSVDLTNAVTGVIVLTLTVTQTTALCPCEAAWYFQAIETANADTNSHTLIVGDFVVLKRRGFGG